jgi:hypothetical protein
MDQSGHPCGVDAFDLVAVVTPESRGWLLDHDARAHALSLAREHGFAYFAVELMPSAREAALAS